MPIVTVFHRIDFSEKPRALVDDWTGKVRQILAASLGGDEPDRRLDPTDDFEVYMAPVGDRPGEHVRWEISIDIEAYDFAYRIANSKERAEAILKASSDAFSDIFGTTPKLAVWLKLVTAEWVESSST